MIYYPDLFEAYGMLGQSVGQLQLEFVAASPIRFRLALLSSPIASSIDLVCALVSAGSFDADYPGWHGKPFETKQNRARKYIRQHLPCYCQCDSPLLLQVKRLTSYLLARRTLPNFKIFPFDIHPDKPARCLDLVNDGVDYVGLLAL